MNKQTTLTRIECDYITHSFYNYLTSNDDDMLIEFIDNMRNDYIKNKCFDKINDVDDVASYLLHESFEKYQNNVRQYFNENDNTLHLFNALNDDISCHINFHAIAKNIINAMHVIY